MRNVFCSMHLRSLRGFPVDAAEIDGFGGTDEAFSHSFVD
jgi:hypothetical protein